MVERDYAIENLITWEEMLNEEHVRQANTVLPYSLNGIRCKFDACEYDEVIFADEFRRNSFSPVKPLGGL